MKPMSRSGVLALLRAAPLAAALALGVAAAPATATADPAATCPRRRRATRGR